MTLVAPVAPAVPPEDFQVLLHSVVFVFHNFTEPSEEALEGSQGRNFTITLRIIMDNPGLKCPRHPFKSRVGFKTDLAGPQRRTF